MSKNNGASKIKMQARCPGLPMPLKVTAEEIDALRSCGFKLSRKERRAAKAMKGRKR